jgi:hypothetical protein
MKFHALKLLGCYERFLYDFCTRFNAFCSTIFVLDFILKLYVLCCTIFLLDFLSLRLHVFCFISWSNIRGMLVIRYLILRATSRT